MDKTLRYGLGVVLAMVVAAAPEAGFAQIDLGGLTKKAVKSAGGAAKNKVVANVNKKLLAEGRKNQCSFKTDSDELMPGCDTKLKKLANALVETKKSLEAGAVKSYKFEVSGHTDSTGKPEHNKELSRKRAAVIVRELVARGVPQKEIVAVGMGAERPVVKNDNTEAKRKKNRRYEIQVRL